MNTVDIENLKESSYARAKIYKLLSRTFIQEVDEEFLLQLRAPELKEVLSEMGFEFGKDFHEGEKERVIEEAAIEYAALFVGFRKIVSPYESVVLEGKIDCRASLLVEKFYAECGFSLPEEFPQNTFKVLPDHLGVEFDFMHILTSGENQAWERGKNSEAEAMIEKEARFLKEHISKWVPKFCSMALNRASHPFYKNMLKLALDFTLSELEEFDLVSA